MQLVENKISYFPGKYLGGGFMGSEVFQGKFEGIIDIAVKRLNERYYNFFEKEVQLLSRTDRHQNVIRYYCNERKDGFRYIALELCNATLKDWVEQTLAGMEVREITDLKILSQCTSGLMFIHEKKIAHRDIKPSNILLLRVMKGLVIVKISDFGLGKQIEDSRKSFTASGPTGSSGWIAPELSTAKKGDKIRHYSAIDIFSLGCIFYYVVTKGGHPYGDQSLSRRQVNIEDGNVQMSQKTPYDSRGMSNLIRLMISALPNQRPPLSIVESHPVFWNPQKILRFSSKVNAWRKNKKYSVQKAFIELELLGKKTGLDKWTEIAFKRIGINFQLYYQNTVTDLNRAFRNTFEHRKEGNKPDIIKNATEEEYVNIWLESFPQLLTCMWIAFKKLHDRGVYDLEEFYMDGTNPFWSSTERLKLINNDLKVASNSLIEGSGDSAQAGPSSSSN